MLSRFVRISFVVTSSIAAGLAAIPQPEDAPKPQSPAESAKLFHLPSGLKMQLLAAEPLIREPSGVCWDEHGRLFVCELHGYNVEGQFEIDELNKKGELDLEVRRIQASPESKKKAEAQTYGTVKLLLDTDGDGVMDRAEVWADHLPPCYGIVPARGGIIVACAPQIVFLADRDGDGAADFRETLFSGFGTGALERGVNAPTWGPDGWIYFGRGWGGGQITGPHLPQPVTLTATDFRIRADGSAIEPVSGSTQTIGMTFTAGGDRFVTNTTYPGRFVTPLAWQDLARNPDAAAPRADDSASDYTTVFPAAPPHPWRIKREQHADYFAFYKRISVSDAVASGYFTSACSPLVYRDNLLPGLNGQYFVCEPAQNLVHRAQIVREGTQLRLKRVSGEEKSEFLTSSDPWFHPISLAHAPDGRIAVVDFYREIIEDYSAIPRHLQQQYGVTHGNDRGRIWLLTPEAMPAATSADLAKADPVTLVRELAGGRQWRRETAKRLLLEQGPRAAVPELASLLKADPEAAIAALTILQTIGALHSEQLTAAWQNPSPEVRRHALRIAAAHFGDVGSQVEKALFAAGSLAPEVALQAALSLGESRQPEAIGALARLAREYGDLRWMDAAIASSAYRHEKEILLVLAADPGKAQPVMVNLAGVLAARGDSDEIHSALAGLGAAGKSVAKPLEILQLGLENTKPLPNPTPAPVPTEPARELVTALERRVPEFVAALQAKADTNNGRTLFQGVCGNCHRSHDLGVGVGPDLDAEFQRAPEVILRDILFPQENIRPGYEAMLARTQRGETLVGIAVSDSPTSLTLRLPGGTEHTVLRKRANISTLRNVSLMPFGLGDGLSPSQVADIIAFLRSH